MNVAKETIEKLMARCKEAWVKWLLGALIGALAAAGVLTVTGCTVSPAQAQDMRALDAFLHAYGALIIQVDNTK